METAQAQALLIEPAKDLKFFGPFTRVVTVQLRLTNPTDRRMCFKVKSNVPQHYCVHPTIAVIEPGEKVSVDVMLQPMPKDDRPDVDGSHKFMVQSIFAPDGQITSLERLWNQTKCDDIMNTKLNCVFEQPLITHLDYLIETMADVCNGTKSQEQDGPDGQHLTQDNGSVLTSSGSSETTTTNPTTSSDSAVPMFVVVLLIAIILGVFYKFLL
jgi:hypothetical protein